MLTEEVLKNIFRIPVMLPGNPLKELNSYLIRDPERSLLVDTGFRHPACREALMNGLKELGEEPGSFDIFLTHLHADHSGLSAEVAGEDRRIFMSELDGSWLGSIPDAGERWATIEARELHAGVPPGVMAEMAVSNPAINFAPSGDAQYTYVGDGGLLNAGGYSLRSILTPGHTPGHMCLWDESCGLMLTGDHVLFDITPNIGAWPDVEDSLGDYLDSLRAVREYPVRIALPGHRKTGDFHARIDELLVHHEVRLAEVERIIRSDPGIAAYDIAGKMRWKIRNDNWDDFPVAQKIFALGECLSHLDYLRLRGCICREMDDSVYRYYPFC